MLYLLHFHKNYYIVYTTYDDMYANIATNCLRTSLGSYYKKKKNMKASSKKMSSYIKVKDLTVSKERWSARIFSILISPLLVVKTDKPSSHVESLRIDGMLSILGLQFLENKWVGTKAHCTNIITNLSLYSVRAYFS